MVSNRKEEKSLKVYKQALPKNRVAVAGYVENHVGEVLLVRTHSRKDSWDLPGGMVEEEEPLHEAIRREVLEEVGVPIQPIGVTGIYTNQSSGVLTILFVAKAESDQISLQPEEIQEARFVKLTEQNMDDYITRSYHRSRVLDAMKKRYVPYELWEANTSTMKIRLDQ